MDLSFARGNEEQLPSAEFLLAKLKRQTERIMLLEDELAECKREIEVLKQENKSSTSVAPAAAAPPPPPPVRDTVSSFESKHLVVLKKLANQTKELEYVQGKYLHAKQSQRKQSYEDWDVECKEERLRNLEQYCAKLEASNNNNSNAEEEEEGVDIRQTILANEVSRLRLESMDLQNALTESRNRFDLAQNQFERTTQILLSLMALFQVESPGEILRAAEEMQARASRSGDLARRAREALQTSARARDEFERIVLLHFNDKDRMQALIDDLFASNGKILAQYLKKVQMELDKVRGECNLLRQEMEHCFSLACGALKKTRGDFLPGRGQGPLLHVPPLHQALSELILK